MVATNLSHSSSVGPRSPTGLSTEISSQRTPPRRLAELPALTACTADEAAIHLVIDRAEDLLGERGLDCDWAARSPSPTLRHQGLHSLRPRPPSPLRRFSLRGVGRHVRWA